MDKNKKGNKFNISNIDEDIDTSIKSDLDIAFDNIVNDNVENDDYSFIEDAYMKTLEKNDYNKKNKNSNKKEDKEFSDNTSVDSNKSDIKDEIEDKSNNKEIIEDKSDNKERLIDNNLDSSMNNVLNMKKNIEEQVESKENYSRERSTTKEYNVKNKLYFSFESRIVFMISVILFLIISSVYLFLQGINYGKTDVVSYNEVSNISYSVCLKNNNFYSSTCLNEGMEYVSRLTNFIKMKFNYEIDFSEEMDYELGYHVIAVTKIFDRDNPEKVLYKNEEVLYEQDNVARSGKSISFNQDLDVDYVKYNNYITNYKNNYSLNSAASVDILFYVDEKNKAREVSSVNIPLGTQTFGILKDNISNKNKTLEVNKYNWTEFNTVCCVIGGVLLFICLLVFIRLSRLIIRVLSHKNKYLSTLNHILREYDRVIVVCEEGYSIPLDKTIIKVSNFDEILDARDTLEKPILYSRINDVKSEFIVEDVDKLYKYVMKESDFKKD